MKKLLVLLVLVLLVLGGVFGFNKLVTEKRDGIELTDEQMVRNYLNDEYGENDYNIYINDTNSDKYIITYTAYSDETSWIGGAIVREAYYEEYEYNHINLFN